jgi:hypothetical protein
MVDGSTMTVGDMVGDRERTYGSRKWGHVTSNGRAMRLARAP